MVDYFFLGCLCEHSKKNHNCFLSWFGEINERFKEIHAIFNSCLKSMYILFKLAIIIQKKSSPKPKEILEVLLFNNRKRLAWSQDSHLAFHRAKLVPYAQHFERRYLHLCCYAFFDVPSTVFFQRAPERFANIEQLSAPV